MFNGNINNKHYTDHNEYNRDLNEIIRKGEPYTASCSFSYDSKADEKTKTCEKPLCNSNDNVEKFIKDNIIDYDELYKMYCSNNSKETFIEACKDPFKIDETQINRLKKFSNRDLDLISDDLYMKTENLSKIDEVADNMISKIDSQYKTLNDKREKLFSEIKNINTTIDGLLKNRTEYENNKVMTSFLFDVYDNIDNIIDNIESERCDCPSEKETSVKDNKANNDKDSEIDIMDVVNSFKELYNRLLS